MRRRIPRNPVLSPEMLSPRFDSLSERVAAALRDAILTGKLKPGERLVEADLAEQLGTSRGPIRDAMKQLQQEGLLTVLPRRGACVAIPSVEEARQMYGLRTVLEEYATTLAMGHISEADLTQLQEHIVLMRQAADAGDLHGLLGHDEAFHDLIWSRSNHAKLLQIHSQIAPQIRAYTVASGHLYPDLHVLADSHRPLLDALRSSQLERAQQAVRDHVALGGRLWVESLGRLSSSAADQPPNGESAPQIRSAPGPLENSEAGRGR